MKVVVVDTSALVRLYVPDGPIPAGLEETLVGAVAAEVLLLAPELLWAELGQVLRKKEAAGRLAADEVEAILDAASVLPLETVPLRPLLGPAVQLARSTGLTVYDALFLALAERRGADRLFTADERLAAAWTALRTGAAG